MSREHAGGRAGRVGGVRGAGGVGAPARGSVGMSDEKQTSVPNYSTRERAEAAVPGWRKLYEDAGMPRLFMVAIR